MCGRTVDGCDSFVLQPVGNKRVIRACRGRGSGVHVGASSIFPPLRIRVLLY